MKVVTLGVIHNFRGELQAREFKDLPVNKACLVPSCNLLCLLGRLMARASQQDLETPYISSALNFVRELSRVISMASFNMFLVSVFHVPCTDHTACS